MKKLLTIINLTLDVDKVEAVSIETEKNGFGGRVSAVYAHTPTKVYKLHSQFNDRDILCINPEEVVKLLVVEAIKHLERSSTKDCLVLDIKAIQKFIDEYINTLEQIKEYKELLSEIKVLKESMQKEDIEKYKECMNKAYDIEYSALKAVKSSIINFVVTEHI